MTPVLGLDASLTCTGWATWTADGLTTGRIRSKLTGAARRAEIAWEVAFLIERSFDAHPLVVIEAVPTRGARAIVSLAELHGVVLDRLIGDPVLPDRRPAYLDADSLHTYATGFRKATKAQMVTAAQVDLGYAGKSDDEADAAWLATVGRQLLGETGPLFTAQRAAILPSVSWPEGISPIVSGAAT